MRGIAQLMCDVYEARAEFDEALASQDAGQIADARCALLFLLDEYFDASADDMRPTQNSMRAAVPS